MSVPKLKFGSAPKFAYFCALYHRVSDTTEVLIYFFRYTSHYIVRPHLEILCAGMGTYSKTVGNWAYTS